MSTKTTNYQFVKPDLDDEISPEQYNGNFDTLDSKLKSVEDSLKTVSDKVGEANTTLGNVTKELSKHDAKLKKKTENAGQHCDGRGSRSGFGRAECAGGKHKGIWRCLGEKTALTRLTPDTDPNHLVTEIAAFEPAAQIGLKGGGGPFDGYAPWNGMKKCSLNADQKRESVGWRQRVFQRRPIYNCVYHSYYNNIGWKSSIQLGFFPSHA